MKLPDRREIVWFVTPGPQPQAFEVRVFQREAELLSTFAARGTGDLSVVLPPLGDPSGDLDDSMEVAGQLPIATRTVAATEVEVHGRHLWAALPADVTGPISGNAPDGPPLAVKVVTGGYGFGRLPWEWLVDGSGHHVALRSDLRLIRTVPCQLPVPPVSVKPPLRVLVVMGVKGDRRVDRATELKLFGSVARGTGRTVKILEQASRASLQAEMHSWEPHVVHHVGFTATAHGEGTIALVTEDRSTDWITTEELVGMLSPSTRLLCLSFPTSLASYRSIGASVIAESPTVVGLPTTIVTRYPVHQRCAGRFWRAFYRTLAQNGDAIEASHVAQIETAAGDRAMACWASFTPVVRDQTGVSFAFERVKRVSEERRKAEIKAQFAAKLTNDLAVQMAVFGNSAPDALREHFEVESKRANVLSGALDDEAL